MSNTIYYGVGRRKTSTARVLITLNANKKIFTINKKLSNLYFTSEKYKLRINKPFRHLSLDSKIFSIRVTTSGGGITGQSDAIALGISRALLSIAKNLDQKQLEEIFNVAEIIKNNNIDDYIDLADLVRIVLRSNNLLTRDSRKVERKKVGLHKARKAPQFSKR